MFVFFKQSKIFLCNSTNKDNKLTLLKVKKVINFGLINIALFIKLDEL